MNKKIQMSDSYNDSDEESLSNYTSNDDNDDDIDQQDIDPVKFFTVKELCYYSMIDKFFKGCSSESTCNMIDIIEGRSNISLRILDWFVTKYSKKKIDYGNKDTEIFDVRISYKSQLKSYKKRYFDPFRRRKKFIYYFNDGKNDNSISTTLGQLNFFKWAVANNVIGYVEKNLKHISKEMNSSNKEEKKKKDIKLNDIKKEFKQNEAKIAEKKHKEKKHKEKKLERDSESVKDIKINTLKPIINDNTEVKIVLKFD
jgi:hypothetical protein